MCKLKALWINYDQLNLTDEIRDKVQTELGTTDMEITECYLDDIDQYSKDGYDYYIVTVNREDLIQELYEFIDGRGEMLVLDLEVVNGEEYDWIVSPPCGIIHVKFCGFLRPIAKLGVITELK